MRQKYNFANWEYEITKNEGSGIQGYGYNIEVYRDGKQVFVGGAYGNEASAMSKVIDIILEGEFGIDSSSDE